MEYAIQNSIERELATYLALRKNFGDRAGYFHRDTALKVLDFQSRSTNYRRLRELSELGFIEKVSKGMYRFISMYKVCVNLKIKTNRTYYLHYETLKSTKIFKAWLLSGCVDRRNRRDYWSRTKNSAGNNNISEVKVNLYGLKSPQHGYYSGSLGSEDLGVSVSTFNRVRRVAFAQQFLDKLSSGKYSLNRVWEDIELYYPPHVVEAISGGVPGARIYYKGKEAFYSDTPLVASNLESIRYRGNKKTRTRDYSKGSKDSLFLNFSESKFNLDIKSLT